MVFQETGRLVSGDRTAPGYLARSGDPYHVPSVNIQIFLSLRETGEVVRSSGRISGRCREQDSLFSGLHLTDDFKTNGENEAGPDHICQYVESL